MVYLLVVFLEPPGMKKRTHARNAIARSRLEILQQNLRCYHITSKMFYSTIQAKEM